MGKGRRDSLGKEQSSLSVTDVHRRSVLLTFLTLVFFKGSPFPLVIIIIVIVINFGKKPAWWLRLSHILTRQDFFHTSCSIVSTINVNLMIIMHQLSFHAFTFCAESEMFNFWPLWWAQNYKIQHKNSSFCHALMSCITKAHSTERGLTSNA